MHSKDHYLYEFFFYFMCKKIGKEQDPYNGEFLEDTLEKWEKKVKKHSDKTYSWKDLYKFIEKEAKKKKPYRATYCFNDEKSYYSVFIDQQTGTIRWKHPDKFGLPVDTANLPGPDRGTALFVIDHNNNMYIAPHARNNGAHNDKEGRDRLRALGDQRRGFFHSSFLSGGPACMAGMICLKKGKIVFTYPKSGHYKPSTERFAFFLRSIPDYLYSHESLNYKHLFFNKTSSNKDRHIVQSSLPLPLQVAPMLDPQQGRGY